MIPLRVTLVLASSLILLPSSGIGAPPPKGAARQPSLKGWEPNPRVAAIVFAAANCVPADYCFPSLPCTSLEEGIEELVARRTSQSDRDCVLLLQYYIGEHPKGALKAELRRRGAGVRRLLEELRVYLTSECSPIPAEGGKPPFLPRVQVLEDIDSLLQER